MQHIGEQLEEGANPRSARIGRTDQGNDSDVRGSPGRHQLDETTSREIMCNAPFRTKCDAKPIEKPAPNHFPVVAGERGGYPNRSFAVSAAETPNSTVLGILADHKASMVRELVGVLRRPRSLDIGGGRSEYPAMGSEVNAYEAAV